jgi:hypothetical protein
MRQEDEVTKLGYCVGIAIALTLAGCGADGAETDLGSTQEASTFPILKYWMAGKKEPIAGLITAHAACKDGDIMLGLSLGNDTDPPLIYCGQVNNRLDVSRRDPGTFTRGGIFPACRGDDSGFSPWTEVARSWAVAYPGFTTTLGCAPGFTPDPVSVLTVDDTQGYVSFTYNGKTRFGHICSKVGSIAIGYDGDHDKLLCAN